MVQYHTIWDGIGWHAPRAMCAAGTGVFVYKLIRQLYDGRLHVTVTKPGVGLEKRKLKHIFNAGENTFLEWHHV